MKYTIEVDDRFWPVLFPEWDQWDDDRRREAMVQQVEVINDEFLKGPKDLIVLRKTYDDLLGEASSYIQISPLVSSEGVARIQAEREEQRAKHGFSDAHDDALDGGELETAAIAVLTEDASWWPEHMDQQLFMRATEKDTQGRLAVAGALIAAELDRIDRQLARQGGPKLVGTTLPPVGTCLKLRPDAVVIAGWPRLSPDMVQYLESLADRTLHVQRAELRGDEVWVQVGTAADVLIPLACCTIIHDEQTTN